MSKKSVAILFGGANTEHEVSLESASYIIENISKTRYKVILIGITKEGEWKLYSGPYSKIKDGSWESDENNVPAVISPDAGFKGIIKLMEDRYERVPVDVIFPVLHGKNGEDGSMQGLFQLANIPFVGCGLNASVACMDKTITNIMLDHAGIKQANFLWIYSYNVTSHMDICISYIENNIGDYPFFVKPANAGSSVGVSKVNNTKELRKALLLAAKEDVKILIEECVEGRELECAVIGNKDYPEASKVGEIVTQSDFYDYDTKYINNNSKLYIPADISEEKCNEIIAIAKEAYMLMGCAGFTRIDFFMKSNGDIYLNELNTIPGFTNISMYPKLMDNAGIPIEQLIDRLIDLAFEGA